MVITPAEVLRVLAEVEEGNAPGPDSIADKILKGTEHELVSQ